MGNKDRLEYLIMPEGYPQLQGEQGLTGEGICGVVRVECWDKNENGDWISESYPYYCGRKSCYVCGPMIEAGELFASDEEEETSVTR